MPEDGQQAQAALQQKSGSLYTALAHTGTRTLALYFSRPVRLFRPSKRGHLVCPHLVTRF
jgi:hypothetical protein